MTVNTTNHDWTLPEPGGSEDQWGQILNDMIDDDLDRQVVLEGPFSERPSASIDVVKYYHATDRRIVYYNDDSTWEAVFGLGADGNPVPGTNYVEALEATTASVDTEPSADTDVARLVDLTGGVTYVQNSEPTSAESGETWFESDTGVYRLYADTGDGLRWHNIPPVQVTEEAVTFEESDVSVTHNNTEISDGSIQLITEELIDDFEDNSTSVQNDNWTGWDGDTDNLSSQDTTVISGDYSGEIYSDGDSISISATRDESDEISFIFSVQIEKDLGNDSYRTEFEPIGAGSRLGVLQFSDGDGEITWFDGDSNQTVRTSWDADTDYTIELEVDYSNDEVQIVINDSDEGTYSLANSVGGADEFEVTNYAAGATEERSVYIDDVVATNPGTSGDALIEWDTASPDDIKAWDLATYQATADGETVSVDVEDDSGTVLFSDIGPNFDISTIDTADNVKLRVNLSRDDTDNNPTLDYVARRFVR